MPCGGIVITNIEVGPGDCNTKLEPSSGGGCWVCGYGGCRHFLIEWDAYIHAVCAIKYLEEGCRNRDSEAEIIIGHEHQVHLDFSLEDNKTLMDNIRTSRHNSNTSRIERIESKIDRLLEKSRLIETEG